MAGHYSDYFPAVRNPSAAQRTKQETKVPKKARMSWAKLLKRVFGIDMESCGHCGGKIEILAAIMEGAAIEKILKHLGRPYRPPDIAPARYPEQASLEF
jgi:hypothetical protein